MVGTLRFAMCRNVPKRCGFGYGIRAPPGFVYLGHSLRISGSSNAEAIGVSRFRGNWFGGWSQSARTRELHYIDPSVAPTPAAYALLGWQLSGDYTVGVLETVEARGAPDSDSPGEVGLRIPPPPPRVHVRASDGGSVARRRMCASRGASPLDAEVMSCRL